MLLCGYLFWLPLEQKQSCWLHEAAEVLSERSSEFYPSGHMIGERGLYGMGLVAVLTLSAGPHAFPDRACF